MTHQLAFDVVEGVASTTSAGVLGTQGSTKFGSRKNS